MASDTPVDICTGIDNHLTCTICQSYYNQPKQLPCSHVYCYSCLDQTISESEQSGAFCCPSCQALVKLPSGKAADLPDSTVMTSLVDGVQRLKGLNLKDSPKCSLCFVVGLETRAETFCVDCWNVLCDGCVLKHKHLHKAHRTQHISEVQLGAILPNRVPVCEEHNKRLDIYCDKCQNPICSACDDHEDHIMRSVEYARKKCAETLDRYIIQIQEREKQYDELMCKVNAARNSCLDQGDLTKSQIKDHGDKLIEMIQIYIKDAHSIIDDKTAEIVKEIDELKEVLRLEKSRLTNAAKHLELSQSYGNQCDVIMAASKVQLYASLLKNNRATRTVPALDVELQLVDLNMLNEQNMIGQIRYDRKKTSCSRRYWNLMLTMDFPIFRTRMMIMY